MSMVFKCDGCDKVCEHNDLTEIGVEILAPLSDSLDFCSECIMLFANEVRKKRGLSPVLEAQQWEKH